ncbi:unnamed protein product [Darwinula stevensoni]|uniref:DUF7869 domain-containing protein n=1 Tax=Darwinula stevensoni TaxID=69355 RepID=A0A7R8XC58_9CRUS|nr:unnamed protein product [Darwinula stevensoni]CAG0892218.1 unnamed protein product [Darwinula stevensoni]
MREKVGIGDGARGRSVVIQFEDEAEETVGVGPVTIRFLSRFTGHVSAFNAKLIDSDFRKKDLCLTFNYRRDKEVILEVQQDPDFEIYSKKTARQGLRLALAPHFQISSDKSSYTVGHRLFIQNPQDFTHTLEDGIKTNLGTISNIGLKMVEFERIPPDLGGNCAVDSYLMQRFDPNIFRITNETPYSKEVCLKCCVATQLMLDFNVSLASMLKMRIDYGFIYEPHKFLDEFEEGVMVYPGKGILEFAYVDMGQYPDDSNLTIEVILRTLLHVKEYLKPKLFLQMDNSTRENKNKYLCALAHLLVEEGIFEEVVFNFHPVGHTHEDIDQLFSSVNHYLRVRDTCTVNDLMTCLQEIRRRGRPENLHAEELNAVHNFKTVIQDHFPRHFRGPNLIHSDSGNPKESHKCTFDCMLEKPGAPMSMIFNTSGSALAQTLDMYVYRSIVVEVFLRLGTTPALNAFGVLVPPDWNAAGLEVVRASIQNYFPEMSEDKVHAWHVFSPDTQQSMEPVLYLLKLRDYKNASTEQPAGLTPTMQSYLANMKSQMLGPLQQVAFNFHPVGHTHEDIDQLFSSVNHYLRVRDTCTVNDLMMCLQEIRRRGRPENLHAEELNAVHNFKTVIQDHFPRHFRGPNLIHSDSGNPKESHKCTFDCMLEKPGAPMSMIFNTSGSALAQTLDMYVYRSIVVEVFLRLGTTPALNAFGVLVPPDWNAAGLEVVRASIQNYFPEMSEDKVHAWHVFSPDTQQSMEPVLYLLKLRDYKNASTEQPAGLTPTMQSYLANMKSQMLGPLQQPIIGSIGSRRLGICAGTNDLHPGMLAVVNTEEKTSRPWMGKITSVEEKEVTIHWYQGTCEKSWNPMTGVESLSTVPRESLLLWGFTLQDKRQLLRSEMREELKRLYQETDQIMQREPETSEEN